MLSISDESLREKLKKYSADMQAEVQEKDRRLQEVGYKNYTK